MREPDVVAAEAEFAGAVTEVLDQPGSSRSMPGLAFGKTW